MGHDQHAHHTDHAQAHSGGHATNAMAISATLHCLTGCAIGEILGLVVGTALGLGNLATIAVARSGMKRRTPTLVAAIAAFMLGGLVVSLADDLGAGEPMSSHASGR